MIFYIFLIVNKSHEKTNMLVRLSILSDFLSVVLSSKLLGSY